MAIYGKTDSRKKKETVEKTQANIQTGTHNNFHATEICYRRDGIFFQFMK